MSLSIAVLIGYLLGRNKSQLPIHETNDTRLEYISKGIRIILDELQRYKPSAKIRLPYWVTLNSSFMKHLKRDKHIYSSDDPVKENQRKLNKSLKDLNDDLNNYYR